MEHQPLVSVITPCYNGEKYVKPFFEGVLSQTYCNFELIFVNDGSTDNTEQIAIQYGKLVRQKGAQFHYIYQKNAGQAAAINQGLACFKGQYIMWIDSDDIMLPNHIEEKVCFLEKHTDFGFVLAQGECVYSDNLEKRIGLMARQKPQGEDTIFEDLIFEKNVVFGPATIMARGDVLRSAIPDGKIFESREGQNWQLMLPLAYSSQAGYLNEVLFKCVIHPDSHSRMHRNYESQIKRLDNFEELLTVTISKIPTMPEEDRQRWYTRIKIKTAKRKMEQAYRSLKFSDIGQTRRELKGLGYRLTAQDLFVAFAAKAVIRKLCKITKRIVTMAGKINSEKC